MVQENPVYHPDLDVHPTQTLPCLPVRAEIQRQSKAFRKPAETSDAGHEKLCRAVSTSSLRGI